MAERWRDYWQFLTGIRSAVDHGLTNRISAAPWTSGALLIIASATLGHWLGIGKLNVYIVLFISLLFASCIVSYYSAMYKLLAGISYLVLFLLTFAIGHYINIELGRADKNGPLIGVQGELGDELDAFKLYSVHGGIPVMLGTALGWGFSEPNIRIYAKHRPWEFGLLLNFFAFLCCMLFSTFVFYYLGTAFEDTRNSGTITIEKFLLESSLAILLVMLPISALSSYVASYYSDSAKSRLWLALSYIILHPVIQLLTAMTVVMIISVIMGIMEIIHDVHSRIISLLVIGFMILCYIGHKKLLTILGFLFMWLALYLYTVDLVFISMPVFIITVGYFFVYFLFGIVCVAMGIASGYLFQGRN